MPAEKHFDAFRRFHVSAMGEKAREICEDTAYDSLTFEEKLELIIDAEIEARAGRRLDKLVREAGFKLPGACVEEILYPSGRKLSKDRVTRLAECAWVDEARVLAIIAKTGCGKSYVAQAFGVAACRKGHHVRYVRMQDLFSRLAVARSEGTHHDLIHSLKTVSLLIIDDFMTTPISTQNAVDLLEVVEARDGKAATIITSQLEPEDWYLNIDDELIADTLLNRLATGSIFLDIEGPNMREHMSGGKVREKEKEKEG